MVRLKISKTSSNIQDKLTNFANNQNFPETPRNILQNFQNESSNVIKS